MQLNREGVLDTFQNDGVCVAGEIPLTKLIARFSGLTFLFWSLLGRFSQAILITLVYRSKYFLLPSLGPYRLIGSVGRVFVNGLGDLGSIPGHVIPKTLKMVLDTPLLNTQQYKVRIKGKVEQSRERSSALPYTSV